MEDNTGPGAPEKEPWIMVVDEASEDDPELIDLAVHVARGSEARVDSDNDDDTKSECSDWAGAREATGLTPSSQLDEEKFDEGWAEVECAEKYQLQSDSAADSVAVLVLKEPKVDSVPQAKEEEQRQRGVAAGRSQQAPPDLPKPNQIQPTPPIFSSRDLSDALAMELVGLRIPQLVKGDLASLAHVFEPPVKDRDAKLAGMKVAQTLMSDLVDVIRPGSASWFGERVASLLEDESFAFGARYHPDRARKTFRESVKALVQIRMNEASKSVRGGGRAPGSQEQSLRACRGRCGGG
ncbi:hypothetical protein B0T26DRAFT_538193 [Lasiosphaeria miniovina]|uniref:Uncharacterized protein n=1 Tax=Lasiosphaeria miniovina TaxID=1954250 RepID=A0AA39ZQV9_9PEZI|nr:uncharacterized protein B0T26DRAFT_538193 [Lasiosphaeria miniovina]KAK0702001.1 hypothetical protein B0T26DRAFT_538193 [Lasiosphaeria miniovina]